MNSAAVMRNSKSSSSSFSDSFSAMARTKEIARMYTGDKAPPKKQAPKQPSTKAPPQQLATKASPDQPATKTPPKQPATKTPPKQPATEAPPNQIEIEISITCQHCKKRQRLDTEVIELCRREEKRKRNAKTRSHPEEFIDLSSEENFEEDSQED